MRDNYRIGLGEAIDRLITVDVSARGVIGDLYKASRKQTKRPLTLYAAEKLNETIQRNDLVYILSGFQTTKWNSSETDGPVGALLLANALRKGLKALPVIITEDFNIPIIKRATIGLGLTLYESSDDTHGRGFKVIGITLKDDIQEITETLFKSEKPTTVVSVERAGWNEKHIYHDMRGRDISRLNASLDPIFKEAQRQKILTIGIGDGGNEIGMGNIKGTVKRSVPYGARCNCPCRGGIAANTTADVIVTSTISNWGVDGIIACLSGILKNPTILHDRATEYNTIKSCVQAGAYDSVLNSRVVSVDGVPGEIHTALVDILHTTVQSRLKRQQN